jgi:hypothetical protein
VRAEFAQVVSIELPGAKAESRAVPDLDNTARDALPRSTAIFPNLKALGFMGHLDVENFAKLNLAEPQGTGQFATISREISDSS